MILDEEMNISGLNDYTYSTLIGILPDNVAANELVAKKLCWNPVFLSVDQLNRGIVIKVVVY